MATDDETPAAPIAPRPIDRAALVPADHRSQPAKTTPGTDPTNEHSTEPSADRGRRRAMWISTAIAVPVTVLVAFALTAGHGSSSDAKTPATGPVSVAPVPVNPATAAPCDKAINALPLTLDGMQVRPVQQLQAVAWGDPPVILRCGVARPATLVPDSTDQAFNFSNTTAGVSWFQKTVGKNSVFTSVDRSVYIEVTFKTSIGGDSVLTPLSDAIAKVLARVCEPGQTGAIPADQLCADRKN
jgi:hypothetical protein